MTQMQETPTYQRGEPVAGHHLDVLPHTSRISYMGRKFLKRTDGKWCDVDDPQYAYEPDALGGNYSLEFIPYDVFREDIHETWTIFTTKFRDSVEQGRAAHGVRENTVNAAYQAIGFDKDDPIQTVPGMPIRSRWLQDQAPVGTVITYATYTYVRRDNGYWSSFHNGRWADGVAVTDRGTLVRWGREGDTALTYVWPTVSEEEQLRVRIGKQVAWQVAMQLKAQHSWCGTLESLVRRGGVTEQDAGGGPLSETEQSSLPASTLLFWRGQRDPATWAVMVRDDSMRNLSRTRLLFGSAGQSRNSHNQATLVTGNTIPVGGRELADALPPYTNIVFNRILWVKNNENEWVEIGPSNNEHPGERFPRNLNRFSRRWAANDIFPRGISGRMNITYLPGVEA